MGRPILNLAGTRFGRLVVLRLSRTNKSGNACWQAECDCGNVVVVASGELRKGSVRSCGCLRQEHAATVGRKTRTTHGETVDGHTTVEYQTWKNMHVRCENPKVREFPRYGGRGITVCERWHSFENFLADMGRRPGAGLSIDRYPNNNGNYEKSNCRWATAKQQASNRRPKTNKGEVNDRNITGSPLTEGGTAQYDGTISQAI